jgi:DNA recombination protein RmuC
MDPTLFIVAVVIIVGVALAFFLTSLSRSVKANSERMNERIEEIRRAQAENPALSLMQSQIGQLTQQVNQQLQHMSSQFQKTTGDIGQTLGTVQSHLGKVEVTTREVLDKAKNISSLEDLLRAPKFRGGLGEFFLGDLLGQILPPTCFFLQHRFKSGEKVDAAININNRLVPVDAKFPLENFKKYIQETDEKSRETMRRRFVTDVKKHIDDIAAKYILPEEGTYDFALMYIPAENVYYETILKDETLGEERSLYSHAVRKRVIPVSPNSFYAYLQVIVYGLKGMEIEKSAQRICDTLTQLRGDLNRFQDDFQVMGTHLANAKTRFDDAEKRLVKFSDRLELAAGEKPAELAETKKADSE